jgi:hypothetical protein
MGSRPEMATRCHLASTAPGDTLPIMRVAYNKLVRDQIPGIIASAGGRALDPRP